MSTSIGPLGSAMSMSPGRGYAMSGSYERNMHMNMQPPANTKLSISMSNSHIRGGGLNKYRGDKGEGGGRDSVKRSNSEEKVSRVHVYMYMFRVYIYIAR